MFLRAKFLASLILVCFLIPVIANCAPQANGQTITIAVVEAALGTATNPNPQSIYAGVKLAADQINARQGVTIKLDVYNDGNDPAKALEIANKVVASQAVAVIGHSSIEASDVAGEVYDQHGIPVINAVPVSEHLTENHPYHFNITYTAESEAAYLANYLMKLDEKITAGVIHTDLGSDEADQIHFRNEFANLEGMSHFGR